MVATFTPTLAAFGDRVDHGLGWDQDVRVVWHLGQRPNGGQARSPSTVSRRGLICRWCRQSLPGAGNSGAGRRSFRHRSIARRSPPSGGTAARGATRRGHSGSSARAFPQGEAAGPWLSPRGPFAKLQPLVKPSPGRARTSQQRANWRNSNSACGPYSATGRLAALYRGRHHVGDPALLPIVTALVGIGAVIFASHVGPAATRSCFRKGSRKACLHDCRSRRQQTIPGGLHQPGGGRCRQEGRAVADGTVITLVQYRAKLGADGNPEKDANGRFIKSDIIAYTVMEKRKGWGAEYRESPQRRVGISGLHGGQGGERERQAHRLLRMPQAAASARGFRLPVQQDSGEVGTRSAARIRK